MHRGQDIGALVRLRVAILVASAVALAMLLPAGSAVACYNGQPGYGQSGPPYQASAFTRFELLEDGPQPKNVALAFVFVSSPPIAGGEAGIRSQIAVEVSRDGADVKGSATLGMVLIEWGGTVARSVWRWLPTDAPLVPGATYHLKLTNNSKIADNPRVLEKDVVVGDREVVLPDLTLTVDVTRQVGPDTTAPTIRCSNLDYITCQGSRPHTTASRYRATGSLTYRTPPFDRADYRYLRSSFHRFSRTGGPMAMGWEFFQGEGNSATGSFRGPLLVGAEDEYCVSVSAWLLTDPAHPKTVEHCHPGLDLTMTDDDQTKAIADGLKGCENPTFP